MLQIIAPKILHRGYYMAARRDEISLRVLKRNFVSPSDHVMFYLLCKHQWNTKPFYLNSFLFSLKGTVYYEGDIEAIAMVIFSHVKITCYFHMWRYQVFTWKLTWYFIGVYIINCFMALSAVANIGQYWPLLGLKGLCYIFKGSLPHGFNSWLELPTFSEFFSPHISFYFSIIWCYIS